MSATGGFDLVFGMPLWVNVLMRSFSSLALFILSICFSMVFYWRSEAAVVFAALEELLGTGLRDKFGAKVHS